jgi:uncharacterized HAD superfamily protein
MKYGFDLDDTLADTASVINKYAIKFNKEYLNGNGDLQDINNSKSYYYFAEGLNWNKENIAKFFEIYYLDILKEVQIKPFVKETINKLKKEKNEVYIITARRKREGEIVEKITNEWLKDNGILYDELFINIKEKSKIVNQLKIDIFIDDSYENCIDVKTNTDAKVYMLSTKYNTGILDKQLERINNIDELISK